MKRVPKKENEGDRREDEEEVRQPHHHHIGGSPVEVGCQDPHCRAQKDGDRRGQDPQHQLDMDTVEQLTEE